jgi:hypothetical protein
MVEDLEDLCSVGKLWMLASLPIPRLILHWPSRKMGLLYYTLPCDRVICEFSIPNSPKL